MLHIRKAKFGSPDLSSRAVPLVLATDAPVDRPGYVEVLDIPRADLSRGDLPLIESHDASTVNVGVVRDIRVDGNKLRGTAVFGQSARADELLADIQSEIVTGVSIGYQQLGQGTTVRTKDGREALKFAFMPFEVSVVAVPADTDAGFYRADPATSIQAAPVNSPTSSRPMLGKGNVMSVDTRNHANEIIEISKAFPNGNALAVDAIQRGLTVEQFQREALESISSKPIPTADIGGANFAFSREAMQPIGLKRLRSPEDFFGHYANQDGTRQHHGLSMTDFMRGAARMRTSEAAQRALSVGVDSAGGYAVPTVLMPGILSALAPASSLMTAGATILPLPGTGKSFSIAGIDALPTAAWRNENAAVAESEPTFREIVLTPRSLSFMVKISRELLADGLGVDAGLYQAIGQAMAKEIDRTGLRGSGTAPEPRGLLNISGVHSVTNGAAGASLSGYANIFSAAQSILAADGAMPTAAIMSPRSLVKLGGLTDTTGQPLRVPAMLESVRLVSTSQIPNNLTVTTSNDCSEIYVGDFSQFVFGMREQVSVQVLEERYADYGQIAFVVHARLDVAVTNPKSFAIVTGVRA